MTVAAPRIARCSQHASRIPAGHLRQAAEIGRRLLVEGVNEPLAPERFERFFREFYWVLGDRLDSEGILPLLANDPELRVSFRTAAKRFRLIDEDAYAVGVKVKGVKLDLGAIGKGFGLDQMGDELREWELDQAMCHGAWSTALALKPPPDEKGWPMSIGDPEGKALEVLCVAGRAISRSGQEFGAHIFDPRTGRPAAGKMGAWALTPTGTEADALSTAFLVMSVDEIEAYCKKRKDVGALLLIEKNKKRELIKFNWPKGV